MKKIYSILTMVILSALFMCVPIMASQYYGVIYDETDLLGSQALIDQGVKILPQLSKELGIDIRVDILTQTNFETVNETALWVYDEYDYGIGDEKEGISLTIYLEQQDDTGTYALTSDDGWCIIAKMDERRCSSAELSSMVYEAVRPFMDKELWDGSDMKATSEALNQAIIAMSNETSNFILEHCPPLTLNDTDAKEDTEIEYEDYDVEYIFDQNGSLSDEEWLDLETRAKGIVENRNVGIYFVIVDDYTEYGNGSVYEVTYQLYNDNQLGIGENNDGIIVLLSMRDRDYAMFVKGDYAQYAFNEYGKTQLEEAFLCDFGNNDWYVGINNYLNTCDKYLAMAEEGKPLRASYWLHFVLVIGGSCLIAGGICYLFVRSMKTVHQKVEANRYIAKGGLKLTQQYDRYTHTTETRVKIEKESSGNSSSESGGGGSGRSGKF